MPGPHAQAPVGQGRARRAKCGRAATSLVGARVGCSTGAKEPASLRPGQVLPLLQGCIHTSNARDPEASNVRVMQTFELLQAEMFGDETGRRWGFVARRDERSQPTRRFLDRLQLTWLPGSDDSVG